MRREDGLILDDMIRCEFNFPRDSDDEDITYIFPEKELSYLEIIYEYRICIIRFLLFFMIIIIIGRINIIHYFDML